MTWTAYVEDDWMRQGVKIGLADIGGPVVTKVNFDAVYTTQPVEEFSEIEYQPLRLQEDAARALLDALLKHFRMTRADENLRVDYLAERARVDKFIDIYTQTQS